MTFESFGFDQRILAGITAAGFTTPTPIQQQAIGYSLEGRDLMGLAQTGTGKTAAFVLPILERLIKGPRKAVRALIISPTRELAEQTNEAIRTLGARTGLKGISIYGGASMYLQKQGLKKGAEIVVACPGRLLDLMGQGAISLKHIEVLVLDEADRMLDMGFMPDIKRILAQVPQNRQTMMFSATMPPDIRLLTKQIMSEPAVVQIGNSQPASTISHALYVVDQMQKTPMLVALLESIESESVLVFTRTKSRAMRVADALKRSGFKAAAIQGDMPQGKRQEALKGFRDGRYDVLVATDIAARGVDVLSISHVINYDIPDCSDTYTHRVGRTGRAERTGEALTLVTVEDAKTVQAFEREMNVELMCKELDGFECKMLPVRANAQVRRGGPSRRPARAGSGSARRGAAVPSAAAARPRSQGHHAQKHAAARA